MQKYTLLSFIADSSFILLDYIYNFVDRSTASSQALGAFNGLDYIALGIFVVWSNRLRADVLLRESAYYLTIVRLTNIYIASLIIDAALAVFQAIFKDLPALVTAVISYTTLVSFVVDGVATSAITVAMSAVYYNYITSKKGLDLKFRSVYVALS